MATLKELCDESPEFKRKIIDLVLADSFNKDSSRQSEMAIESLRVAIDGLDIVKVADKAGVHEVTIKNWLNGYTEPRADLFKAVINACGYDLDVVNNYELRKVNLPDDEQIKREL